MGFNTFPCNPYPISTDELNKGNNDDLNTRVTALESEVSDLNSTKANQITIAPFFSAEASYSVGDLVYYNGLTYRCTNDHEGEWDADDFAATTIAGELDTLNSGLLNINNALLSPISNANKIAMSDANMANHNIGGGYDFNALASESHVTWFTNWTDETNFPAKWGSGVLLPGTDISQKGIIYMLIGDGSARVYTNNYINGAWGSWKQLSFGPIFVGTLVLTPQVEGRLSIPFSLVGVSVRPASVFVTLQSKQGFATYDFDASTNDYIEIIAFEREYEAGVGKNTFIPIVANAQIRICIMVYA